MLQPELPSTSPAPRGRSDAQETTGSAATLGARIRPRRDRHPRRQDVTEKIDPTDRGPDAGCGGGRDAVPEVGPRLTPETAEARAPHPHADDDSARAREEIGDVLGAALRHSRRWQRVRRARGGRRR